MSQPIKRDKVLDMSNVIKSEGGKKIKELEQELEEMREHKKKKDKLETDLINQKDKYHQEKSLRQKYESQIKDLETKCSELQNSADENAKRF